MPKPMNIIEAIQQAENGKLITGAFIKKIGDVLKYAGNGVFFQYALKDNIATYKYDVRDFSMSDIISNDWDVVKEEKLPIYWVVPKTHNSIT